MKKRPGKTRTAYPYGRSLASSVTSGLALAMIGLSPVVGALADERAMDPPGKDLCRLVTKSEVSRTLGIEIVRAEAPDSDLAGCDFSVRGSGADLAASHTAQLAKGAASANGSTIDGPTEQLIETFGKTIFKGSVADTPATARHPGEVPVFTFAILPGNGSDQMRLTRQTHTGLSPQGVTTVANLGDEAFDSGGAMLSVRKGNRMIQFTYPSCSCTTREIVPLARKVVDQL
jgi:hypothetical protein